MAREYTKGLATDPVISLLNKLIDKRIGKQEYASTLQDLGKILGGVLLDRVGTSAKRITLACTVEDADYLGRGILDVMEKHDKQIFLTVFWNQRFKPNAENGIAVAPILREFHEKGYRDSPILVIIKSIISGACVVRTNLTKLIEDSNPERIFVVAPVLLKGATKKLDSEFDREISKKFEYLYFAEDSGKNADGDVDPGIGGEIYRRLGFEGQSDKNRYTPEIVRERRRKYS